VGKTVSGRRITHPVFPNFTLGAGVSLLRLLMDKGFWEVYKFANRETKRGGVAMTGGVKQAGLGSMEERAEYLSRGFRAGRGERRIIGISEKTRSSKKEGLDYILSDSLKQKKIKRGSSGAGIRVTTKTMRGELIADGQPRTIPFANAITFIHHNKIKRNRRTRENRRVW